MYVFFSGFGWLNELGRWI